MHIYSGLKNCRIIIEIWSLFPANQASNSWYSNDSQLCILTALIRSSKTFFLFVLQKGSFIKDVALFSRDSSFYPKRVIQIDGLELSSEISLVKKVIQKNYLHIFLSNSTLIILCDYIKWSSVFFCHKLALKYCEIPFAVFDIKWHSFICLI